MLEVELSAGYQSAHHIVNGVIWHGDALSARRVPVVDEQTPIIWIPLEAKLMQLAAPGLPQRPANEISTVRAQLRQCRVQRQIVIFQQPFAENVQLPKHAMLFLGGRRGTAKDV